jgi:hypothetical protein
MTATSNRNRPANASFMPCVGRNRLEEDQRAEKKGGASYPRCAKTGDIRAYRALVRAIAVLLIGSLGIARLAVFATGTGSVTDRQMMSTDMEMDSMSAAADEMPCDKRTSDRGKPCPFMAICMALCCQAVPVFHATVGSPLLSHPAGR